MKKIIIVNMIILLLCPVLFGKGNSESEKKEYSTADEMMFEIPEEMNMSTIKTIRQILPELAEDTKKLLIENPDKLWPGFDNSRYQVLLVSTATNTALLINSRNSDIGPSDEIIEYSANSLKDTVLRALVTSYTKLQFNGHTTYVFNVDFWGQMHSYMKDKDELYTLILKAIIHESVHLLLQSDNMNTMETTMSRGDKYPENVEARYYRNEIYAYLIEAIASDSKSVRMENIKKAMFFYEKYKNISGNDENYGYDFVEGQPTYIEERALAYLQNETDNIKEIETGTLKSIVEKYKKYNSMGLDVLPKPGEPYDIGAAAIALVIDTLGTYDFSQKLPLDILHEAFGSQSASPHSEVEKSVIGFYEDYNEEIKTQVDSFLHNSVNPDYVAISIPRTITNTSSTYSQMIQYNHKGLDGLIVNISAEFSYKNGNRLMLKQADAFEYMDMSSMMMPMEGEFPDGAMMMDGPMPEGGFPEGAVMMEGPMPDAPTMEMLPPELANMVIGNVLVYVKKSDIEISGSLLTVQNNDIIVFDAMYNFADNQYTILLD